MMNKQLAGVLLGAAVVGGVLVGVGADALTSDSPSSAATRAPSATPPATKTSGVEVKSPVFVMNDDGTATLSATLVNRTQDVLDLDSATGGQPDDLDAPRMLAYFNRSDGGLERDVATRVGGVGDDLRIRFRDRVQVGSTLPVTLTFIPMDDVVGPRTEVTALAPVVERSAKYADVAGTGPNSDITVNDGVFVVVPGQEKAFIGGYLTSKIADGTDIPPTATGRGGLGVEVLHQTATGGPSGFVATPGEKEFLGQPPYLDTGGSGDYVRARDVTVGQTLTVTFRFPSGDVVGKFKVVRGAADGTV